MGGSNFADVPPTGKYTYSERAIPYVENEAAYHTGTFNNATYFDKIDAIKNGDIDAFNALIAGGADTALKDNNGKTALFYAESLKGSSMLPDNEYEKIITLLSIDNRTK